MRVMRFHNSLVVVFLLFRAEAFQFPSIQGKIEGSNLPGSKMSHFGAYHVGIKASMCNRRYVRKIAAGKYVIRATLGGAADGVDALLQFHSTMQATSPIGLAACMAVGLVLGLLGGGGSILAVPVFIFIFEEAPKVAIAESLAVVSVASTIGCLTHIANNNVNFKIAVPFGVCACFGSYFGAKVAADIPSALQLGLFAFFAVTSSVLMLRAALADLYGHQAHEEGLVALAVNQSADGTPVGPNAITAPTTTIAAPALAPSAEAAGPPRFTPLLAAQAVFVGLLTACIGAGGGFVIVPSLTFVAGLPVKVAVGSSLLIGAANALSGFSGYADGSLPLDGARVAAAALVAGGGAVAGTLVGRRVPQGVIKLLFAGNVLVLAGVTAVKMALQATTQ